MMYVFVHAENPHCISDFIRLPAETMFDVQLLTILLCVRMLVGVGTVAT